MPKRRSSGRLEKAEHQWKQKRLPSVQPTLCPAWADARSALARELKGLPVWLEVQSEFVSSEHHPGRGRPRKDATPAKQWHIQATVTIKQPQIEQEVRRKACFIVATNVLDSAVLSEEEVVSTYKGQGSVERGFRFLRISLVSGLLRVPQKARAHRRAGIDHGALRGTVYRLAEHRLRTRLAETEQTVPDQLNRPTARPTMRWIFQCFEGIELLHIHSASEMQSLILRLQPLHRLVLAMLGPPYEKIYTISS